MTITPMMQYIQERAFTLVHKQQVPEGTFYYRITLSRLLTALGGGWEVKYNKLEKGLFYPGKKIFIDREFLNSDGTDATLFDQSQETITAIGVLLGRETVKLDERYMFVIEKNKPMMIHSHSPASA